MSALNFNEYRVEGESQEFGRQLLYALSVVAGNVISGVNLSKLTNNEARTLAKFKANFPGIEVRYNASPDFATAVAAMDLESQPGLRRINLSDVDLTLTTPPQSIRSTLGSENIIIAPAVLQGLNRLARTEGNTAAISLRTGKRTTSIAEQINQAGVSQVYFGVNKYNPRTFISPAGVAMVNNLTAFDDTPQRVEINTFADYGTIPSVIMGSDSGAEAEGMIPAVVRAVKTRYGLTDSAVAVNFIGINPNVKPN